VIAWIESNCVFTAARWYGEPFRLLGWQKRLILELFELEDGRRKYRWAYISVPKKNGKTELMAALALWFLCASGEPSPLVVCAAGNDDQADLIFQAATTMAKESPTLSQVIGAGNCFEDEITCPSVPGGKIRRVAASARRHGSNLDGKNIFVVICDELHVWEGERGRIVWGTLTRGTVARSEPMVLQITTAGFDRDSICWQQYEHARKVLADPSFDPAFYAHVVEAPESADFTSEEVWAATNPSFGEIMSAEFYQDQLTKQPENQFRRFYLNQWTRSQESWLPAGAWDGCRSDLDFADGPVFAGVDVALFHDHTAVCLVQPRDGRWIVRSKVWAPGETGIDVRGVMQYLRDVARERDLRAVAFDPKFFELPASELADEGVPMIQVDQSRARMVPQCGFAYSEITAGRVAHDGDPVLEDHVLSAVQSPGEQGWTLSKGKSKRKIDACIAMVLALWLAAQRTQEPAEPFVLMGV